MGSMGKRRARLLAGICQKAEIYGVDCCAQRRAEAERMGLCVFESLEQALCEGSFDAAFVCTAPLTHAQIILQLLRADISVFTELNLVSNGYAEMCQEAAQRGLVLFLSSTMLYRREIQYIKQQIHRFARPVNYVYHIGQYLPDWHPWEHYRNFFVGDSRTGGVKEILGIDLPWLFDTFGPVKQMMVQKDKISELDLDYDDSCCMILRHESGVKGMLAVDVVSPKPVRNLEVFGEGLHLFWEGSPQTLYYYDVQAKEKRQISTYEMYEHDVRYSDNVVENAYADELQNFFDVLKKKAEPKWSFEKDLQVF